VNADIGVVLHGMDARALLGAAGGELDVLRRHVGTALASAALPEYDKLVETIDHATGEAPKVHRLRHIDTLPPRLAEVELDDDGRPRRIKLRETSLPRSQTDQAPRLPPRRAARRVHAGQRHHRRAARRRVDDHDRTGEIIRRDSIRRDEECRRSIRLRA
jgi:hypothetical protein